MVKFVNDFISDYLARADAQDNDKRAWRSEVFTFDTTREARLALKKAQTVDMDEKLYCLEVERIKNLDNMTNALLMLALSMDALTRLCSFLFSTLWAFILCGGLLECLPV